MRVESSKVMYRHFCWECFRCILVDVPGIQVCRCGRKMELMAACVMGEDEAEKLERLERRYEAMRHRGKRLLQYDMSFEANAVGI